SPVKAVEEGDELLTTSRVHREFERSLDCLRTAICEVRPRWRLHRHDRVELLRELWHVTIVIISAAHVDQLCCLFLDSFDYVRMAMACRADSHPGVAIQKDVAVNV